MRLDVGLEGLAEAALASGEREVIDEAGGGRSVVAATLRVEAVIVPE